MMSIYAGRERTKLSYKILSAFIAFTFSFTSVVPPSYAQSIASLNLPVPGTMVAPSAAFVPVLLKGMTIYPDNPLQFDFIIDSGNTDFKEDQIKTESQRLVKYFLASMTIPKDDLWVNLSPYEKDRIIPDELGKTELGRDMLAQDYILKQLTASLMYPEKELGKEFWDKVYKKAQEKYGTTEIPVDTFNKVWILPETATVYEHGQTVYIVEAKLRVMLDSDYEASRHEQNVGAPLVGARDKAGTSPAPTDHNLSVSTEIIREIILPEIEHEVNYGQNFAPLRQIYHSLILAKWYKETIKNSLLSKIYVDQKKIAGVDIDDATLKDQIYAQYMEAYKKGVFNYIKEDYDRLSNDVIPRKYFSGGEQLTQIPLTKTNNPVAGNGLEGKGHRVTVINTPQKDGASSPIAIPFTTQWHINRLAKMYKKADNIIKHVKLLGNRGDTKAVESLKYLMKTGGNDIAFGEDYSEARKKRQELLESADNSLRKLGLSDSEMFEFYLQVLKTKSESKEIYGYFIERLGESGNVRALEAILNYIDNVDNQDTFEKYYILFHKNKIRKALKQLNASEEQLLKFYLKELLISDGFDGTDSALEDIDRLNYSGAIEYLIQWFKIGWHGISDERHLLKAFRILTKLENPGEDSFFEALGMLLSNSREYVRYASIEASGELGDRRAIEPLLKRLSDSDERIRRLATEALKKLEASKEQLVDGYIKALSSGSEITKEEAAQALGKLGDKNAISKIENLKNVDEDFIAIALTRLVGEQRLNLQIAKLRDELSHLEYHDPIEIHVGSVEIIGPYGDSWGYQSVYETKYHVNHDEYMRLKHRINRLLKYQSKNHGGSSSSPLEPGKLNIGLAKKILEEGKISIDDIGDGRLRRFLHFLKQNNLVDVVVMGGAIKSILFNEKVADIDISVKAALTDGERAAFAPLAATANERVYKNSLESITQLAKAMGIDAFAFLPPSRGVTKAFEGLNVDYFGPLQTDRGTVVKRSLFDTVTRKGYFTNTAAGLLRFAIDADGNIYGDTSALQDLLQGKLTIQGDGTNFGINDVLRVLRIKHQYGLQISDEDDQLLKAAASRYRDQSLPPIVLGVAQDQIKKILTNAVDRGTAEQELETLGISALVEKAQSSSPITPQEARAMIKWKLLSEDHHLISDTHVQLAMAYEGNFDVVYHAGPPESIEIVGGKKFGQSSSPAVEQQGQGAPRLRLGLPSVARGKGQGIASDEIRDTNDDKLGGIDMNAIDLDREGGGVDIQFDPAELQELIDAGIDGFAPVIINITPLPSVLPLLGLDPANKEDPLEVSVL